MEQSAVNNQQDLNNDNKELTLTFEDYNLSITKTEDIINREIEKPKDRQKEAFYVSEHFLSQTFTEWDKGQDVNHVVGASADTLYTTKHIGVAEGKQIIYSCNVCEKDFKVKRDCLRHVRSHTGEKPFRCYDCGEYFGREDYLTRHLKTHSGEKPFSCPKCNRQFARKTTLDQHLLTHIDKSERPFPCNKCEKAFIKKSHLETHLKTHNQESAIDEQNPKMNAMEESGNGLDDSTMNDENKALNTPLAVEDNHIITEMEASEESEDSIDNADREEFFRPQQQFSCPVCKKVYPRKDSKDDHIPLHKGISEMPFPCNQCEKGFVKKSNIETPKLQSTNNQQDSNNINAENSKQEIGEQNPREESEQDLEGSIDNADKEAFYHPQDILSQTMNVSDEDMVDKRVAGASNNDSNFEHNETSNIPLDTEQNQIIPQTEENDEGLENSMDGTDKEDFCGPEHFLSQTINILEEDLDANHVADESAETTNSPKEDCNTDKKQELYSCTECEKVFKENRALVRHARVHTGEKPFECYKCGQTFGREDYLTKHIKTRCGKKTYPCPVCKKNFNKKKVFDKHLLSHYNKPQSPFPCKQCEKGFVKRSNLESHLETHKREESLNNEREIDEELNQNEESEQRWEGNRVYPDEDMDASPDDSKALYSLTHTYVSGRKRVMYRCNICQKYFKDKRACTRHLVTHTGKKPFKCYECGMSFGREDYLIRHMKRHTGEKPFSCLICSRNFAVKSTLDQHLLTHMDMDERPFPCNQCEKSFVKKSHLERHLKIHSPIKDHVCRKCLKGFTERGHLKDHMKRIHSDRVLPSCKKCNRKFRWNHLLKLHMEAQTCNKVVQDFEKIIKTHIPIFVSKDKQKNVVDAKIPSPEKQFKDNLPIFVSKDNKGIPLHMSNSQSLQNNELDADEDGLQIINNQAESQKSEIIQSSNLTSSAYEPLSTPKPMFQNYHY